MERNLFTQLNKVNKVQLALNPLCNETHISQINLGGNIRCEILSRSVEIFRNLRTKFRSRHQVNCGCHWAGFHENQANPTSFSVYLCNEFYENATKSLVPDIMSRTYRRAWGLANWRGLHKRLDHFFFQNDAFYSWVCRYIFRYISVYL